MSRIKISDHAVVRYLERVHGIDIDAVRKEMADMAEAKIPRGVRNMRVNSTCGIGMVVKNGTLITVYTGK